MGLNTSMKRLGDICSMKYGKMPKKEDLVEVGGYPVFTGYLISGYHKDHMCKEPEIIVVARGIGGAGDIKMSPPKSWITNISIILQVTDSEVDKCYLYWNLVSTGLRHLRTGSAQPQVIIADLKNYLVELPPLQAQHKIAAILSAYDDLIENNLRRIKILEEMAQNLYREWFVNFRFPGHENTRFVDSPLGEIPEGWGVQHLSNLVSTQYGYTASAKDEAVGPKYLRGTDINKRSYIDWDLVPYCVIDNEKYIKYKLCKGDIVIIRMADPGKVGMVEGEVDAVFASYLVRLNIETNRITPYYLYYFLMDDKYQGYITGASTGTTRKSASASVMTGIDILIPDTRVVNNFESQVNLYRCTINSFLKRNAVLRQNRDLLLPRLISGEVDVTDLDITLPEEAV